MVARESLKEEIVRHLAHWREYVLAALVIVLLILDIIATRAASERWAIQLSRDSDFFLQQLLWMASGLLALVALTSMNYKPRAHFATELIIGILLLLAAVFIFANTSWGPRYTPFLSDLAKLLLVVTAADWLACWDVESGKLRLRLVPFSFCVGLAAGLVAFLPNLGTAMVIVAVFVGSLIAARVKLVYIVPGLVLGIAISTWLILSFSSVWGTIPLDLGAFSDLRAYIPSPYTVHSSDLGTAFVLLAFVLFAAIVGLGVLVSLRAPSIFTTMLGIGCTLLLFSDAVIRIVVTAFTSPGTNVPLPIVGEGGLPLFVSISSVGILIGISRSATDAEHALLAEIQNADPANKAFVASSNLSPATRFEPRTHEPTSVPAPLVPPRSAGTLGERVPAARGGPPSLDRTRETMLGGLDYALRVDVEPAGDSTLTPVESESSGGCLKVRLIPHRRRAGGRPSWSKEISFRPSPGTAPMSLQVTYFEKEDEEAQVDFYHQRRWLGQATVPIKDGQPVDAEPSSPSMHDYDVDISLRIRRRGARYWADLLIDGELQRVPLGISPHDLEAYNQQLQEVMQSIAKKYDGADENELTRAEARELLESLATTGNYVFRRVFSHHGTRALLQHLLTSQQGLVIQVASEDFFLPWELLYPGSLNESSVTYQQFLGMNHIISRAIVQDDRPGAFVPPEIPFDRKPTLALLSDKQLPSVEQHDIPYFRRLRAEGKIRLLELDDLNPENRQEGLGKLRDFLGVDLDLVHFSCHAKYNAEWPDRSEIWLSDDFGVRLIDMEVYEIAISGNPLVILNACETGNLNPLYTSNFAASFLRSGARGVVATECVVPDNFASAFGQKLHDRLLSHTELGQALLETRWEFLDNDNPSGLLYSMYAPPSVRLREMGG